MKTSTKAKAKKSAKPKKSSKAKKAGKASAAFFGKSKRLAFRLLDATDNEFFCSLFMDSKTMEFVGQPLSHDEAERSFRKALELTQAQPMRRRITVIVDRASKKAIGISSIKFIDAEGHRAEGGMMFHSAVHSKRYSLESSLALIDEAFLHHSIDELCVQVALNHKIGERLVRASGHKRGPDLAATASRSAVSTWSTTRDAWVSRYKQTKN